MKQKPLLLILFIFIFTKYLSAQSNSIPKVIKKEAEIRTTKEPYDPFLEEARLIFPFSQNQSLNIFLGFKGKTIPIVQKEELDSIPILKNFGQLDFNLSGNLPFLSIGSFERAQLNLAAEILNEQGGLVSFDIGFTKEKTYKIKGINKIAYFPFIRARLKLVDTYKDTQTNFSESVGGTRLLPIVQISLSWLLLNASLDNQDANSKRIKHFGRLTIRPFMTYSYIFVDRNIPNHIFFKYFKTPKGNPAATELPTVGTNVGYSVPIAGGSLTAMGVANWSLSNASQKIKSLKERFEFSINYQIKL